MKIILQKHIARSGMYSRRQAEELIRRGKVEVDGVIAQIGDQVDDEQVSSIKVNGREISLMEEKFYIKLNKPKGYVCTTRKFKDEKNVFDLLPKNYSKLNIVGRLDKDSRGLVLLTNDGELTYALTHPRYEHEKRYFVQVTSEKPEVKNVLRKFNAGIDIGEGDGKVKARAIRFLEDGRYEIILTEGKKRQIRRMFKAADCQVTDLERTEIAGIRLGDLKEGRWENLNEEEIKQARKKIVERMLL